MAMKRGLTALVVFLAVAASTAREARAESLVRGAVVACSFGAGVFAAATYYRLMPVLATGALAVPVTEVIAANALVGCGVGVVGAVSASVTASVYDFVFGSP